MSDVMLGQVMDLIKRLSPADKARLIAFLAPAIVQVLEPDGVGAGSPGSTTMNAPSSGANAWAELARIGAELSAMGPASVSSSEALAAMRR